MRRLDEAELAGAPALLVPEGWGFTLDELTRLHRLGGSVGALRDGALVGFLTFTDFAPVRWIGNVVVGPQARGEGVGARMVAAAMEGARTTGLYSVEKAVSLYERLGFEAHGDAWALRAERARPAAPSVTQPLSTGDLREVARLDREASGMDRAYLLRALHAAYPDGGRVVRARDGTLAGYGFARPSPDLTEVGPLVARDEATANAIMDALIALTPSPHEMTCLGANDRALAMAQARGFTRSFRTITMFAGKPPSWSPRALFASAGLEKG